MSRLNEFIVLPLLAIALLAVGFSLGRRSVPQPSLVNLVDRSELVEAKKQTAMVQTVVKYRDGKITERIVTRTVEKQDTTQVSKETASLKIEPQTTIAERPSYSVGYAAQIDPEANLKPTHRFDVGYRVLGNLWATGSANLQMHEFSLGARIDF